MISQADDNDDKILWERKEITPYLSSIERKGSQSIGTIFTRLFFFSPYSFLTYFL